MKKEESIFLDYKGAKIHMLRFGEGKELLFAFHGYAYDARLFLPLEEALGDRYRIYAIDLPFHGETEWPDAGYKQADVVAWIQMILQQEDQEKFALLGYSYGGRVVQKIVNHFPASLSHIYLIAPDGIFTRGMVNAHLVPKIIRVMIKNTMRNPKWVISIARLFNQLGLLSNYNLKFISFHLDSQERRNRLFNSWISMKDFILYPRKTKAFFRKTKIPIKLYFGSKDEAIPLESGKWMAEGLENVELEILEKGHRLIGSELIERMKQK